MPQFHLLGYAWDLLPTPCPAPASAAGLAARTGHFRLSGRRPFMPGLGLPTLPAKMKDIVERILGPFSPPLDMPGKVHL